MTEDEARMKSCPYIKSKCIGSMCMMWEPYEHYTDGKGWYANQNIEETRTFVTGGDCGLKTKDLNCNGAY